MNRQQKEAVIKEVRDLFDQSQAAFLVGYKGLTVAQVKALRKDLREAGGVFKVTKARLMKIAASDITNVDEFSVAFKNQVGLVFVKKGEVPLVAKKLVNYSKENELLNIVSGYFESKPISKNEIGYLAALPSKEVLLAQILGTINAPASRSAGLVHTVISRLLNVLKHISEKEV